MSGKENGFSILELIAAVSFLVVGVMALALGIYKGARLDDDTEGNHILTQACRNVVASLQETEFRRVAAAFGPGSGRDAFWCRPDGAISFSPGRETPRAKGRIEFFLDESDLPRTFFGGNGSFDLNANGAIDHDPVADYKVLPTRLTVLLDGVEGARSLQVDFLLVDTAS